MNTAAPDILNLANYPDLHAPAAEWFSSQWHVPTDAYRASMADGLHAAGGVPAWYIVRDGAEIGAGIGIIANDFHKRPDLTPNLCALYVAPPYRGRGWAIQLLGYAFWFYENHDRTAVRLHVSENNARAITFYQRSGFVQIGRDPGVRAHLLLMGRLIHRTVTHGTV